jgi:hypothetical protein
LAKISQDERERKARKAMADYLAEGQAARSKTLRLRELRLAKETADKQARAAIEIDPRKI